MSFPLFLTFLQELTGSQRLSARLRRPLPVPHLRRLRLLLEPQPRRGSLHRPLLLRPSLLPLLLNRQSHRPLHKLRQRLASPHTTTGSPQSGQHTSPSSSRRPASSPTGGTLVRKRMNRMMLRPADPVSRTAWLPSLAVRVEEAPQSSLAFRNRVGRS